MSSLALLPNWLITIYVFVFGICCGSFLNVAILRGLKGEDIVFGRSRCPKCKNKLKWYMNIPLLSFLFLRGKCGFCKCKISWQYPIVEFICGLCFIAAYFAFGLSLKAFFICIILSLFILLAATDFLETVIIDIHAYILLGVGLLYSFLKLGDITIVESIIASIVGFLVFELMARIGKLFCGIRTFGEGDSLIALGIGAIFGIKPLLLIVALSILLQSVFAIPVLVKKAYVESKKQLAFSYVAVFISMVLIVLANYFKLVDNYPNYYLIGSSIVIIALLYGLKNIVQEIKNKKDNEATEETTTFSLFPFGPALIFSSSACLFFLSQIKVVVKTFLSSLV